MDPERHERILAIFEQVEAAAPEERRQLLDRACAEDPTLRPEVLRLLAASEAMSETFLEPALPSDSRQVRPGDMLNHYQILERLGAGGMGEVFLATDTKLKRRVALKVLPPDMAEDRRRMERFQREAESLAALSHPHIVTIYSIEEAQGLHFLTMEMIDGPSLRQQLDRSGAMPISQVLQLATQIADALAEAHAAGIVHRDLKPANVMISTAGRATLVDFGLARAERVLARDRGAHTGSLTREGTVIGTVSYMSPEQLLGRRLDARSDVFSFGILLYELTSGQHPFRGQSETSTLAKILETEPRPLNETRSGLPPELERIVARCLKKQPDERYQDTRDLLHELRSFEQSGSGEGQAVAAALVTERAQAQTVAPAGRVTSQRLRRRVLMAASLLLLGLVLVIASLRFLGSGRGPPQGERPQSLAVLPLRNLSEDPLDSNYLANGISQAVISKLTRAGLRVTPWETAQRYVGSDQPIEEIAEELGVDAVLAGTFQLVGDRLRTTLSLIRAGSRFPIWDVEMEEPFADLFEIQRKIAVEAAESLVGQLTVESQAALARPPSTSLEAYDLYLQGAEIYGEGDREAVEVAFQYFEEALAIDPELAPAHVGRGAYHLARFFYGWGGGLDNLDRAEEDFNTALQHDAESMRARRGLIHVWWNRGRSDEVLIQAREAARLGRPDDVETLLAGGEGYLFGGMPERAVRVFERILELDPLNEEAHWFRTIAAIWAGELETTVEAGLRYLALFGESQAMHLAVAYAHHLNGRWDQAREHYEKTIPSQTRGKTQIAGGVLEGAGSFNEYGYYGLGHLQRQVGQPERARETFQTALELAQERLELYPEHSDLQAVKAVFEVALDGVTSWRPGREPSAFNSHDLYLLAGAYAGQGQTKQAAESLQEALNRGRVSPAWRVFLRIAGGDPADPELASFSHAFEAESGRLADRFSDLSRFLLFSRAREIGTQ